ncbi:MAG TPA: hypothetical protein VI454_10290, partial [Verrucomicrobiae bacterium]
RKDGAILAGRTNSSITLFPVSATDAGTYAVSVSGACSSASNSATLTVAATTSITPLLNQTNNLNMPATFSTAASGVGPFAYVWRKNGVLIPSAMGNALTFDSVTMADAAIYTVDVTGPCGTTASSSASLTIAEGDLRPRLTGVSVAGANVLVSFTSLSGRFYRLESADNLGSNQWTTVTNNIPGAGGIMQGVHVGGAGAPTRFYRIELLTSLVENPNITGQQTAGGDSIINFTSAAGEFYRVERRDNPTNGLWELVLDLVPGTSGDVSVEDFGGASQTNRVYRVLLVPGIAGPPRLSGPFVTGSDPVVRFTSVAGRFYQVESTGALTNGGWTIVTNPVQGSGRLVDFTDKGTGTNQIRFYRVGLLP